MQITNTYRNKPVSNIDYRRTNQVQFSGLKDPSTKCMFVFDLDGTFANGTGSELNKIVQIAEQRNARLTYATGRSKKQFENLQQELAAVGKILPTPEYLVCDNGKMVYENIDGMLVKDAKYGAHLKAKADSNSKIVLETVKELANSDKYKFTPKELQRFKFWHRNKYKAIQENDPDFYQSKISLYGWDDSEHKCKYFVAPDVSIGRLKQDIQVELGKSEIKTNFTDNKYTKNMVANFDENILLKANTLRRNKESDNMTVLFLFPTDAEKADGIKYLRNQLDVPYNEILMAGNGNNDVSMAKLAKKGAYFICVGNATIKLRQVSNSIKQAYNNMFMTRKVGAKGILEGMSKIIEDQNLLLN